MQIRTISIAPRFCGPTHSGNGGYVCGLIAAPVGNTATVRLFAPPPLSVELALQYRNDSSRLLDGDRLIGEARPATLDLIPPKPPSFAQAQRATQHYAGFRRHIFPDCFVCGPRRSEGDGLGIFPGVLLEGTAVAAPWRVDASLAVDGAIPDAFIWAALDCPGAFAAIADLEKTPVVLGQLTARIDQSVSAGQHCIVIGWPLGCDGRKHFAGTAVFDEQGNMLAVAKAVWIEVEKGRFA